jgi:hypothetical protein
VRWLALLVLSQNLNVTPIESRQAGARLSTQRQYVVDCRTNMTCAVDGGVLYLSASGGAGGKVAEAYAADASITAQMFDHDPTDCSATQYATAIDSAGNLTCSTPSGGGGSANFSADTATFAGKSDVLKTVTAAWATPSSSIICTADGEEASVEGAQFVVVSKASGSFVVRGYVLQGRRTGATPFTCTGN